MASLNHDTIGEYLSAYVDDELTANEREAVEQLVLADPAVRAQLDELRETVGLVHSLPTGRAPADLLQSLTADAERRALLDDPNDAPTRRRSQWSSARQLFSMAAALLITVAGAWYVFDGMNPVTDPALSGGAAVQPPGATTQTDSGDEDRAAERFEDHSIGGSLKDGLPVSSAPKATLKAPAMPLSGTKLDESSVVANSSTTDNDPSDGHAGRRRATQPDRPTEAESTVSTPERMMVVEESELSPRGDFDRLAASLNFAQKISGKLSGDDIATHNFNNETNKIIVLASSETDVYRAQAQLADFALSNDLEHGNMLAMDESPGPDQAMFFEGAKGINFDEDDQSQILLRAPASKLPELVTAMSRGSQGPRPLTVEVGPIVASGSSAAQALLAQNQQRQRPHVFDEDKRSRLSAKNSGADKAVPNERLDLNTGSTVPKAAIDSLAKARGSRSSGRAGRSPQPTSQATTPPRRVEEQRLAMVDEEGAKKESLIPEEEGARQIKGLLRDLIGPQFEPDDSRVALGEAETQFNQMKPGGLVDRKRAYRDPAVEGGQFGTRSKIEAAEPEELVTFIVQIVQSDSDQEATSQPAEPVMPSP